MKICKYILVNNKARQIIKKGFYEDVDEARFPTDEEMKSLHTLKSENRQKDRDTIKESLAKAGLLPDEGTPSGENTQPTIESPQNPAGAETKS